jgi:hypothetical protein
MLFDLPELEQNRKSVAIIEVEVAERAVAGAVSATAPVTGIA